MFGRALIVVGVSVATLILACGSSDDRAPISTIAGGLDGASLFAQTCASCHGPNLEGTTGGPPFIDSIYRPAHHADAAFLLAVRRGVRSHHWDFGNMPRIDGLSDEQVAAIVEFVRAQQRAAGID